MLGSLCRHAARGAPRPLLPKNCGTPMLLCPRHLGGHSPSPTQGRLPEEAPCPWARCCSSAGEKSIPLGNGPGGHCKRVLG